MSKANDLTGRTFGLLKVLRRVEDVKPGRPMWLCECRCGKSVVKSSTSLTKQNGVKSCGCLRHQKSPELIDLTDMTLMEPPRQTREGDLLWQVVKKTQRVGS